MGHFSHNCKLTGIPITGGTKVVLFPMTMRPYLGDNSEKNLKKFGTTYQCSNDTIRMKFSPCWLPIKGEYDDYGGMENIEHDDNTKVLEDYYGLTIEQIVGVITCHRKDDGYSENLDCIKDKSVEYEYGKPVYQERYQELLPISGMWIHREVYDKLVEEPSEDYFDKLDFGIPAFLKSLGFEADGVDETKERYKLKFKKDNCILYSDGTWIDGHVYTLPELKKLCKTLGTEIDISQHLKKGQVEQLFDYVVPEIKNLKNLRDLDEKELEEVFKNIEGEDVKEQMKRFFREDAESSHVLDLLKSTFLNGERYKITNKMTLVYYEAARQGKLRSNLVEFWRFDHYMWCMGRYYAPVGTGPQDGEPEDVKKVINIANDIINKLVKERNGEDE